MTYMVHYVEGSDKLPGPMPKNLKITRKGVVIFSLFSKYSDILPWESVQRADIKHFTINESGSAAGALAGGLLLGPVGAIAGGLSSSKRTGTSINISYLTPTNDKRILVLELNYIRTADKIKRDIDYELIKRFGTAERIEFGSYSPKPESNATDVISSLEKLSALRKDGTLSEDEFQEQKKLLLNR